MSSNKKFEKEKKSGKKEEAKKKLPEQRAAQKAKEEARSKEEQKDQELTDADAEELQREIDRLQLSGPPVASPAGVSTDERQDVIALAQKLLSDENTVNEFLDQVSNSNQTSEELLGSKKEKELLSALLNDSTNKKIINQYSVDEEGYAERIVPGVLTDSSKKHVDRFKPVTTYVDVNPYLPEGSAREEALCPIPDLKPLFDETEEIQFTVAFSNEPPSDYDRNNRGTEWFPS